MTVPIRISAISGLLLLKRCAQAWEAMAWDQAEAAILGTGAKTQAMNRPAPRIDGGAMRRRSSSPVEMLDRGFIVIRGLVDEDPTKAGPHHLKGKPFPSGAGRLIP